MKEPKDFRFEIYEDDEGYALRLYEGTWKVDSYGGLARKALEDVLLCLLREELGEEDEEA